MSRNPKPTTRSGLAISVICEETTIVGNMRVAGSARVDGDFEGDIAADERVHVGVGGSVHGTIEAPEILVDGCVDGRLKGDRVQLTPNARVSGAIEAGCVVMELGARLDGSCHTIPATTRAGHLEVVAPAG